jgi:putative membrane protein
MKNWFVRILVSALSVLITAELLSGVKISGVPAALIVALVLSFLNTFLKPILLILTIPVTLFTFGLFLLVINGIIILVADYLLDDFYVENFWWAFLFSVILSLINSILNNMLGTNQKNEQEDQDQQRLQ